MYSWTVKYFDEDTWRSMGQCRERGEMAWEGQSSGTQAVGAALLKVQQSELQVSRGLCGPHSADMATHLG